jgi:hypothetical protein
MVTKQYKCLKLLESLISDGMITRVGGCRPCSVFDDSYNIIDFAVTQVLIKFDLLQQIFILWRKIVTFLRSQNGF